MEVLYSMTEKEVDFLVMIDDHLTQVEKDEKWLMAREEPLARWGMTGLDTPDLILALQKDISSTYDEYAKLRQADASAFDRQLLLASSEVAMKEAYLTRLQRIASRPTVSPYGRYSEADIDRAKSFPISELLGVKEGDYVQCPFCPSERFWTKGGFGHCFACGRSCNSLRYLMNVKGMKFVDAMNALGGQPQ